ncbi:hypothetical protein V1639_10540 [Pseudarthrobacter sp. J75]|nr:MULTISPECIES: hypothetical protein [unclassified Pseudarthrobacter]MEE2522945.1 hypothetical protein [Pseudarthrobacter sp. J47]MEE2529461.1 hypothetical protein [Pseudarthrobacter sp. J75]
METGGKGRSRRSGTRGLVLLATAVFATSGCTVVDAVSADPPSLTQGPVLSATPSPAAHQAPGPATVPEAQSAGTVNPVPVPPDQNAAQSAKEAVEDALAALAGRSRKPNSGQVVDALAAAGFSGPGVEVSATRTPTGLEADAVQAAVLQGADCIVGHIREGTVTVTVLPVLSSGRCFVGSAVP